VLIKKLIRRWRALTKKEELEHQLDDELRYHLEQDTARNIQSGMSEKDAKYAALRSFGNVDQSKEECRDAWGVRQIENLLQDLRYSVRLLVKSPTFTFLAILTLTLGIGANTAIFSLLDAVMLRSLPVKDPDELVLFGKAESGGLNIGFPNESCDLFSFPFYETVRQRKDLFQDVGSLLSMTWIVHGKTSDSSDPKKLEVQLVSGSYFPVLGMSPYLGRLLGNDDDKVMGQHPVTVVSYAWWQRELGGDPNVVGKTVTIEQTTYSIIGVTPTNFISTTVGQGTDLWIPLAMSAQLPPAHWNGRTDNSFQDLYLIGRLNNGVTPQQANATVNVLFKQFLQNIAGSQPSAERIQDMQRGLGPTGRGRDVDAVSAQPDVRAAVERPAPALAPRPRVEGDGAVPGEGQRGAVAGRRSDGHAEVLDSNLPSGSDRAVASFRSYCCDAGRRGKSSLRGRRRQHVRRPPQLECGTGRAGHRQFVLASFRRHSGNRSDRPDSHEYPVGRKIAGGRNDPRSDPADDFASRRAARPIRSAGHPCRRVVRGRLQHG